MKAVFQTSAVPNHTAPIKQNKTKHSETTVPQPTNQVHRNTPLSSSFNQLYFSTKERYKNKVAEVSKVTTLQEVAQNRAFSFRNT